MVNRRLRVQLSLAEVTEGQPTPVNTQVSKIAATKTYQPENYQPAVEQNLQIADPSLEDPKNEKEDPATYEHKRTLVKSILQKFDKGNPYQSTNDLIDSAVAVNSKGIANETVGILKALNDQVDELDEQIDIPSMKDHISDYYTITRRITDGPEDESEKAKNLTENLNSLEKVFVTGMFNFMPDYLNRQKFLKLGQNGNSIGGPQGASADPISHRIEVDHLKKMNDKLKTDVSFLKEQKQALEKIIK